MADPVDAHMDGRAKIASYRKLLQFLRDELSLKPILYKDYALARDTQNVVLLRHDVDHSLHNAEMLAAVENSLGIQSTYFMLHPGDYGQKENYYGRIEGQKIVHQPDFFERCRKMQDAGHEIAIHTDFFQLSYLTGRPVRELFEEELRAFEKGGVNVRGTASHGSTFIRSVNAANYEMFSDCRRTGVEPRTLMRDKWSAMTHSFSLADVGLDYEAYYLPRNLDLTDTGAGFVVVNSAERHEGVDLIEDKDYDVIRRMAASTPDVRMPVLIHPCWWMPGNGEGKLVKGSPAKSDPNAGKTAVNAAQPEVGTVTSPAQKPAASISVEEIRANSSAKTFPVQVLSGAQSSAAFFCAAFMGRNDVIHLHDAKIPEIWLNDIDVEKLEEMARIYGSEQRMLPGDSFAISRELAAKGRIYDVVVLDPFTSLMKRAVFDEAGPFMAISRHYLIGGMCKSVLDELGLAPKVSALNGYLRARGVQDFEVSDLVMRNPDYQGGIYWMVMKRVAGPRRTLSSVLSGLLGALGGRK